MTEKELDRAFKTRKQRTARLERAANPHLYSQRDLEAQSIANAAHEAYKPALKVRSNESK